MFCAKASERMDIFMKKKILAVMLAVLAVAGAVPVITARAGNSDENYDVTKSVINSIEIDRQGETLSVGDNLRISIQLNDDVELLDSVGDELPFAEVHLYLKNSSIRDNNYKILYLPYVKDSHSYEGEFKITDRLYPGTWGLYSVNVGNTSNGYCCWDLDLLNNFEFAIQNDCYINIESVGDILSPGFSEVIPFRFELLYESIEDDYWKGWKCWSMQIYCVDYEEFGDMEDAPWGFENDFDFIHYEAVRIGDSAFRNCQYVERMSLMYDIGNYAFENCSNLESIYIREEIVSIGDAAFMNCKNLSDITIEGEKLANIGDAAFKNCQKLEHITIPESVTSIGKDAFDNTPVIIYSTENAYAHTYAIENGIEWRPLGYKEPVTTDELNITEESSSKELESTKEIIPTESETIEEPVISELESSLSVLSSQQIAEAISRITAAKEHSAAKISMGNITIVPKDILNAVKGKDVDIVFDMGEYSWTINGTTVLSKNLEDINLEVTRHTNYIPNRIVSALAGSNPVEQISLTHNGHFGFTANLTLNVGNQYAGQDGNLYYYDSDGKMVFINAGTIDNNGNVSLAFSHASDYAIVITKKQVSVTDGTDTSILPETGDTVPMKLFALLPVSVGTIVFVNIMGKKNKMKQ